MDVPERLKHFPRDGKVGCNEPGFNQEEHGTVLAGPQQWIGYTDP